MKNWFKWLLGFWGWSKGLGVAEATPYGQYGVAEATLGPWGGLATPKSPKPILTHSSSSSFFFFLAF
jgi:hypothetical protein